MTRALLDQPVPPVPGQLTTDHQEQHMTEQHMTDTVLTAGLTWLYEIEQPDSAWQHSGLLLPVPAINRLYSFIPADDWKRAVVAVDVGQIEWIDHGPNELKTPANPLEFGELDALAAELRGLGCEVASTWNGHPQTTGSVGLVRPVHPSLVAAVDRYRAGCQEHPQRSVFCDCADWRAGFERVVRPAVPTAA